MKGLISELKRRNVLRTAAAYLAGSWLILQVAESLEPAFGYGTAYVRYLVIVLAIGAIPVLAVSWTFEWTPSGIKRDEEISPADRPSKAHARTWDRIIVVVMALALGLFAFDRFVLSPQREALLIEQATEAGAELERSKAPVIAHESVAVLPFSNLSADPTNEYFSDGLTETLLHMLAQLSDIKVAARTSSFLFKDKTEDVRTIAATLSVAHILEGSVQKFGNRVRISAQLVRGADGYQIWSHHYDRELDDIFAIQDEIAKDVANSLGIALLTDGGSEIVGMFTEDATAYDIFLQAREQQVKGTIQSLELAETLFKEALERDPSFADAKLALVRNIYLQSSQGFQGMDDNVAATREMLGLISEMLAVNPDNLEARQFDLRLRADLAFYEMELPTYHELVAELVETFQEGNGNPHVRARASAYLAGNGRFDEGLQLVRDGLVNDPLNVDLLLAQANLFGRSGRPKDAEQSLLAALELQPGNPVILWYLGMVNVGMQDILKGLDYWRRTELADPNDPRPTHEILLTFTEVGMYEHAERWMQELRSRTSDVGLLVAAEIQTAGERGDENALRKVVPEAIDDLFRKGISDTSAGLLLLEYTNIVIKDGNAGAALDRFEANFPGVTNIVGDTDHEWQEQMVRMRAVLPLIRETADDATWRQTIEAFDSNYRESGRELNEGSWNHFWMEYHLNGFDAGKKAFFHVFPEDIYILSWRWHRLVRENWTAELRADPDIAAAIADRNARVAVLRGQIEEMVQGDIWQEQ